MNNEETIIMQSENEKANEMQNTLANENETKQNTGRKVAAVAGTAMAGAAAGAGAMYAASSLQGNDEDEEGKKETEAQKSDAPVQKEAQNTVDNTQEGPDYTGHNDANPVDANSGVYQTATNDDAGNVHVTSYVTVQGENGQPIDVAVVTDGEREAAVADTNGDGMADVLAMDANQNGTIDSGEVRNITGEGVAMSDLKQDYLANQGQAEQPAETEVHTVSHEVSQDPNEVKVLGIYQSEGPEGQPMEAAVLSNGQEVAVVVDVDNDGTAEAMGIDHNHNLQIEEGEVYDISGEQVPMSGFEHDYLAQQQQQEQEQEPQPDTFAYNAGDDQQDYNNSVDI